MFISDPHIHNGFDLIFTAPAESADCFSEIDDFIEATLSPGAQHFYRVIIDAPVAVASQFESGLAGVLLKADTSSPFQS